MAAFSSTTPWLGLGLAIGGVALVNQMSYGTINIMIKNVASPELLGAAVGLGSSIGTAGMALGPIWGGSLFAYSSDPNAGLGPILGKGRLFFLTLSLLAVLNDSQGCAIGTQVVGWSGRYAELSFSERRKQSKKCSFFNII